MTPFYAKDIHMLEGLDDDELVNYLDEHPQIVHLFEIDVIETAGTYTTPTTTIEQDCEPNTEALMELCKAQDAFDQEMEIP